MYRHLYQARKCAVQYVKMRRKYSPLGQIKQNADILEYVLLARMGLSSRNALYKENGGAESVDQATL